MNDLVEIGVFAPGQRGALGEALYLQRQPIRSGAQTIRITVPRKPARAGMRSPAKTAGVANRVTTS